MSINQPPIPVVPPLLPTQPVLPPCRIGIPAISQGRDFSREALIRLQASRQQTDL